MFIESSVRTNTVLSNPQRLIQGLFYHFTSKKADTIC